MSWEDKLRRQGTYNFWLPLAAVLYGAAYHYAYVSFVNPEYEYAHLLYVEPSNFSLLLSYLLIAIPLAVFRPSPAVASYGAMIIYAICYVPAQLILLFNWERSAGELVVLQTSVAASMTVLLATCTWGADKQQAFEPAVSAEPVHISPFLSVSVGALTVIATILLIYFYGPYMRIVALDDIYDLRFESGQVDYGAMVNYTVSWLSYCSLPFYYARGILKRNPIDIAIGLMISLLLYAAAGSKTAIFMVICIYGVHLLYGSREKFFLRLLLALFAGTLVVALMPDDEFGPLRWIKAMVLIRLLGIGGWNMSLYYDFFPDNGFTYYTHIGPINALFGGYPYGNLTLGQVIGYQYYGTEETNANAGFWASDAIAAVGVYGIPIVTMALCSVWYALNRSVRGFSARFACLWLCGFWQGLLNAPLTTALLSGGGILVMVLVRVNVFLRRENQSDASTDELGPALEEGKQELEAFGSAGAHD